ncbi:hypothetical protein ABID82_006277 [Methylobacterium sp. PvP062]|jgi:hypothetical protein|uniref:Uncharacterized protein n=2 Tax=Methylobacterium radiotolerans TaxID=31998 RepID=B1M2X6_METRJ|nr:MULTISPECIES: hypothetical protein [Methylobacterium]MCX7336296.1 hypothetical protein [Hyphomicrobiales bacterium]ACB23267.1 hypothetical protein Mrad2831_1265 [Methylobacterium radiotolerans JCM 2831]KIU36449.1 hypothetical protein SR39_06695 [Methylobacterium radiotolerans]MBP2493768.1 hypothetical protein [Methylobacterium sp. PvP105]MBP2499859.1 hypothetical protein [Methylobacterium sp. PvP109]
MTAGDPPNKMAEVAGLAAAIADHILAQHEAGTTIPPDQFRMLVSAARMLLDNGVPWPPSVTYLVMEVARRVEEAEPPPKGDEVVEQLTQALDAARPT